MRMTEKVKRWVWALGFAAYFFMCYTMSAQKPMKFSCGKTDTVYVSVANGPRLLVSCSGHNHTEWVSVTIGFVDGELLEIYSADGYDIFDISKLSTTQFDYISFDQKTTSLACVGIRTKDYFIDFFNKH